MARSIWSGPLTFGMVSIPADLIELARKLDISGRSTMNRDQLADAIAKAHQASAA